MVLHGHNALTKLKGLIGNQQYGGPSKLDVKDTLRSFYAVDRVDNAFYNSDTVEESLIDEKVLFSTHATENSIDETEKWQVVTKDGKAQGGKVDAGAPVNLILQQNQVELALVVISPTLVSNNDFVYVVDDFNRSKFAVSALKMKSLSRESLEALFKDQCPRNHNLDVLESEFKRGDALLMVVEKVKAVEEAQNLVGKFGIKINSDWEKKKTHKKQGF
jgi:nucleoside diphosphate kinase